MSNDRAVDWLESDNGDLVNIRNVTYIRNNSGAVNAYFADGKHIALEMGDEAKRKNYLKNLSEVLGAVRTEDLS